MKFKVSGILSPVIITEIRRGDDVLCLNDGDVVEMSDREVFLVVARAGKVLVEVQETDKPAEKPEGKKSKKKE